MLENYIESWGLGTIKIFKSCAQAGLPEPRIIEKDGGVEVLLYNVDPSEKLRARFGEGSEKISTEIEHNLAVLSSEYPVFIDYLAVLQEVTSEKVRRKFRRIS